MSKSYFPTDRAGRIAWYNNFANEFPKVGRDLGFTDGEITNAVNDSKYAAHVLHTLGPEIDADAGHVANAVLSGQSSGDFIDLPGGGGGAPPAVRPGIDTRRQARVERIKSHSGFTPDVGSKLKIATSKLEEKDYQAELGRARQTGNFVTIPFRKAGGSVSGINLYRQAKRDKSPQKVGFFFRTPAIDTSPVKGDLSYTARAVVNNKEIGQASDAVSVTVN